MISGLLYNFSMQSIRLGLFSAAIRAVPFDSSAIDVLAGFSAGMIGALITSPLSLVKVRLQTQGSLVGRQTNYSGVFDGLKKVFREEGGIRGIVRLAVFSFSLTWEQVPIVVFGLQCVVWASEVRRSWQATSGQRAGLQNRNWETWDEFPS